VAPKKPGHPKKKKILTAEDKDNIANAINDLVSPHIDRAIDIIKRDTGQMVS
jgi:bromodomain-containing factor 1